MSPWDFPPEYGIEPGERCGRNYNCKGRMITERPECGCWSEAIEEAVHADEPIPETFICTCGYICICNLCGEIND